MTDSVYSTSTNKYAIYEKRSHSKYNRRCIDGSITGCGSCVGYCQYEGHPGFLTEKHRSEHNCIGKGCFYYVEKPQRRKADKKQTTLPDVAGMVAQIVRDFDGMRVMKADFSDNGQWVVHYITISNDYPLKSIAETVKEELGILISWHNLNYSFDKCVSLIMES